jgi:hypothetical protein
VDALRQHGYAVDQAFFESAQHGIQRCLAEPHDFVLVGKAPPAFLLSIDALTDRPIVLGIMTSAAGAKMVQSVGALVDVLCVPESD